MELTAFLGPAKLATLAAGRGPIAQDELAPLLQNPVERLLVRCHPGVEPEVFPDSIRSFTPEAAGLISDSGVLLIGTDAPSVDSLDAKELTAHKIFFRSGVSILENLYFTNVEDGDYELIALPLRIAGGDAAPVRAVLRRD
jgi:arylformamidase